MNWKNKPYTVEVKAGQKVAYCTCKLSESPPFCDGAHSAIGLSPMITPFETNQTVAFCGCGASKNRPFCDGSHNQNHEK